MRFPSNDNSEAILILNSKDKFRDSIKKRSINSITPIFSYNKPDEESKSSFHKKSGSISQQKYNDYYKGPSGNYKNQQVKTKNKFTSHRSSFNYSNLGCYIPWNKQGSINTTGNTLNDKYTHNRTKSSNDYLIRLYKNISPNSNAIIAKNENIQVQYNTKKNPIIPVSFL